MEQEDEPAPSLSLDGLASDVLQHVFAQAGAEAGVRLAACSHKLHSEAARCQALWDHVLDHGNRQRLHEDPYGSSHNEI